MLKDLYFFCIQMKAGLDAGVTPVQALSMLSFKSSRMKRACEEMMVRIDAGATLSDAMAMSRVFPQEMVAMVAAGEYVGNMPRAFEEAGRQIDHRRKTGHMLLGASIYPMIIFFVMLIASIAVSFFSPEGSSIRISAVVLVAILLLVALVVAACLLLSRTPEGKKSLFRMTYALPLVKGLVLRREMATFLRTLGSMYAFGVNPEQALDLCEELTSNPAVLQDIARGKLAVRNGNSLGDTLRLSKVLPSMVKSLVRTGEESGNMDSLLIRGASYVEEELEQKLKIISAALPTVLLVLAVLVVVVFLLANKDVLLFSQIPEL